MWWALLMAFGLGAGAGIVAYLSLQPPIHRVVGLAGMLLTGATGAAVAVLAEAYSSPGVTIVAILAAFGSVVGGYWLATALLPSLATRPRVTPLSTAEKRHARTAVVCVACVEPERYALRTTLLDVAGLQQAAGTHVPDAALPFLLASERARYGSVGGSGGRAAVARLLERLTAMLPADAFTPPVMSWCTGDPLPDEAVAEAVRDGAGRVVVLPLAVAPSVQLVQTLDRLGDLQTERAGVTLMEAPYLDDLAPLDERLADAVAERLSEDERGGAGVLLVGGGQPPEWDRAYPDGPDEETGFMQRVRLALGERGFDVERVRLAWAEWRQPDVTDGVRHLGALGCSPILVVPACEPFPTLASVLDVDRSIELARVEAGVGVERMPHWGDDEAVVGMIADSLRAAVAEA